MSFSCLLRIGLNSQNDGDEIQLPLIGFEIPDHCRRFESIRYGQMNSEGGRSIVFHHLESEKRKAIS